METSDHDDRSPEDSARPPAGSSARCPGDGVARRDFLNGLAIGAGSVLANGWLPAVAASGAPAPQDEPGYYPPLLEGMRGSHPGSYEIAHAVRDGRERTSPVQKTGEIYDLVVVGAGIGGLAAAHFYQQRKPGARILILDNHDDFGGHAKRNEFVVDGKMLLSNGGTWAIESPFPYSPVAAGLIAELGIDPAALERRDHHPEYYAGLGRAVFFDRETFGADRLATGLPSTNAGGASVDVVGAWKAFVAQTPLASQAQADIVRIETGTTDYFPGSTSDQKKERLSRMSYQTYLLEIVQAHPDVVKFYQARTYDLFAVGIDGVTALDCWGIGCAGFAGLDLAPGGYDRMGFTAKGAATPGQAPYTFHFPDGNATIARLLVRRLVPGALPGTSASDSVTARADYARLDADTSPVRIRLSSTVIDVEHVGSPASARAVDITYARGGTRSSVRGRAVVMACWNMIVPYVVPALPPAQRDALHYGVKVPLVYTKVALRNWRAFERLGVSGIEAPAMFHSSIELDEPVDIGEYQASRRADQPIILRLLRTPCKPGLSERDQHRVGRADLLQTPFATFERNIRDQLTRVLGPAGFDATRDIAGITVNRWPHGYAYEYNPLWDPDSFFDGGVTPNEIARKPFGRITIANSDAAAAAYTDKAIDEAHRAVSELPD
jgi:spermidine dehydrogenase